MPSNRSLANLHISDAMTMFYMHKLTVQEGGGLISSESMLSTGIQLATFKTPQFLLPHKGGSTERLHF